MVGRETRARKNKYMHRLKLIFLPIVQFVKQVCSLPQWIATGLSQRRQRAALDELEAERLDRIRNPSKYLGK
jgi:hypothetical protein